MLNTQKMNKKAEQAYNYIADKLFSNKTNLIYDHVVNGREDEFPTADEIGILYPNPCGYSTGMEDGMINGATMLDACLLKHKMTGDKNAANFAKSIIKGQLKCAFSAKTEGFIPRTVSPIDGESHYPDSSRDQYTMLAFGLHRYLNSKICTTEERADIARLAVAIARRAEKNVTKATGYDILTEDGRPTLVNVMWGDTLDNHEYMRLPMLYLLAYEADGNAHWLEKYREIREAAYEKSMPMKKYWHLYALQQMQVSILLCYDADPDIIWRERYLNLMNTVSDYAENMVDEVRESIDAFSNYNAPQLPFRNLTMVPAERFAKLGYKNPLSPCRADSDEFFTLQDGAQIAIITGLVPNRKPSEKTIELLLYAFDKIDLDKHERNLPVFFLDGYYRTVTVN